MELGLGTSLVATRLARELGCTAEEQRRAHWVALLRHIGCTAGSHEFAAVVGDEIAFRGGMGDLDFSDPRALVGYVLRAVGGDSPLGRARAMAKLATSGRALKERLLAVCEVASRLADALGFDPAVRQAIGEVYERWDGRGFPAGVPRRASTWRHASSPSRTAEIFVRLDGLDAARQCRRRALRPRVRPRRRGLLRPARGRDHARPRPRRPGGEILAAEPGAPAVLDAAALERALLAVGDFADLKSPYTIGHSRGVAALACAAATHAGLGDGDGRGILLAGLVHDLGRVGVSSRVWGKEAALSRTEWEQVRLHPYTTERLLARADPVAPARRSRRRCSHTTRGGSHDGRGAGPAARGARAQRRERHRRLRRADGRRLRVGDAGRSAARPRRRGRVRRALPRSVPRRPAHGRPRRRVREHGRGRGPRGGHAHRRIRDAAGRRAATGRAVAMAFALFVEGDLEARACRRAAIYMDQLAMAGQLGLLPEPQVAMP